MDIDDLRTFTRIADAGSISAAARASGLPKSSLSRSLARFEGSVGAILFERGSRALRLTEAGRVFLPHARRILDDVADAGAALDGLHGAPRGTLRINAAMTFALGMVAPMLPAFLARYPDVRVVLDTENRIVDLAREEVDVAIRIGALPDSDLIARKLADIALWPCASPAYLARNSVPATPDDLARHVLLGWSDLPSEWRFTDAAGGDAPRGGPGRYAGARASGAPGPASGRRRDRTASRFPRACIRGSGVAATSVARFRVGNRPGARRLCRAPDPVRQGPAVHRRLVRGGTRDTIARVT